MNSYESVVLLQRLYTSQQTGCENEIANVHQKSSFVKF